MPSMRSSRSRVRPDRRSGGSTARPTSGDGPTSSGTSTSRVPSSCSVPGATTRRSGSSGSSTTTPASSSVCASCRGRRRRPSSSGWPTASSWCGVPLEVMSDNGAPFVVWMPGVLTLFGRTLADLRVRHVRTQVNSPWTNGKIERFWGVLQSELLDREVFRTPEAADEALARFARLLRLPPPPRGARLADPRRALRRHALHRPRLRARPGARAPPGLAHRADGGVTSCLH